MNRIALARCEFKTDDTVQKLAAQPSTTVSQSEKAQVTKSLGDLAVDFNTVSIVDGSYYVLDMLLRNQSTKKSVWVATSSAPNGASKTVLLDSEKFQWTYLSGMTCTELSGDTLFRATEIKPGDPQVFPKVRSGRSA